jgi:hypothetical protein
MNQVHLNETDDAFLARANLIFYLDDDPTRSWDKRPRRIVTWMDVLRSFVLGKHGPPGPIPRGLMSVFMLDEDAVERIHIDKDELARCVNVSPKRVSNALLVLEQDEWICRLSKNEVCLESRLVERAKRIYARLASAAGYDVDMDTQSGETQAQTHASVIVRQTSLRSAEPRRTFEARTFLVGLDKTS